MQVTFRNLAEISEKSPGYSVVTIHNGTRLEITNIHFERRNGRRNRSNVLCNVGGKSGIFDADCVINILD